LAQQTLKNICRTGVDLDRVRLQPFARRHPLALDAVAEDVDGSLVGGFDVGLGLGHGAPGENKVCRPKRFHGSVSLDPARVGRDAGRVADEVIAHLAGLVGSSVKVTLEIDAAIEAGAPENVVRTVTENSRTLKFDPASGFEKE
jgi:hypothetical protein